MTEALRTRFLLFMTAVDDDLLEEALASPARKLKRVLWGALAACLCAAVGLAFWRSGPPGVTADDLAGYGYTMPLPAGARHVRYALLPGEGDTPIAQAEFDRGGRAVTLRALKTDTPQDIFDGGAQTWTEEMDWNANGTDLALRANGEAAQVTWYADQTQWAVRGEMTPADLLDTVDLIFSALGRQLSHTPEGAEDVHYNAFYLDGLPVGETTFTLDGAAWAYRIAPTYDTGDDFADISGLEGGFARSGEAEVGWCPARLAWDDGGAGKVVWFDKVPGQLYSLTVDAGASQERLLELARGLFAPAQGDS